MSDFYFRNRESTNYLLDYLLKTRFLMGLFLLLSIGAQAQIEMVNNVDSNPPGWTLVGFSRTNSTFTPACQGSWHYYRNFWSSGTSGTITSPNQVAASNGQQINISFTYKANEWSAGSGTNVNLFAEYSTNNGTSWTQAGVTLNISGQGSVGNQFNLSCTEYTATIAAGVVPAGSDFRFRIRGALVSGDGRYGIDLITVIQASLNPPACVSAPTAPANNATNVVASSFSWAAASGVPSGYKFSLGTNPEGDNLIANQDLGLVTSHNIGSGILLPATEYFWSVTPYNDNGEALGCDVWTFTTAAAPNCATNLSPANNATDVLRNPTLTWTAPTNPSATSYDLFFGLSESNLIFAVNVTATSVSITPPFPANTLIFWRVVPKNAIGDALGCEVNSFTTGVGLSYCASGATSSDDTKIGSFTFGDSVRPGTPGCATYTNRTADAPFIAPIGSEQFISVLLGTCSSTFYNSYAKVFIDYNQNGIFDEDEMVFEGAVNNAGGTAGPPLTGNIIIPATAVLGQTRLRVVLREFGSTLNTLACGTFSFGETQDYSILVLPQPSCPLTTGVSTSDITIDSAQINWNFNQDVPSYDIEYGLNGFTPGSGTLVSATQSPFVITDLIPGTDYQFYINANCGVGDLGMQAGPFAFTTVATCLSPTSLVATQASINSADISWQPSPTTALDYEWAVTTSETPPASGTQTTELFALATGLTPNLTYYLHVRANCGDGDFSPWATSESFSVGYCIPIYSSGIADGDLISRVRVLGTTLDNESGTDTNGPSYTFFTGAPNLTAELRQGTTYQLGVSIGSFASGQFMTAWIDFNNDGVFDENERLGFTTQGTTTAFQEVFFPIALPNDAPLGTFRMRVRLVYAAGSGANITPCGVETWGEAEDYDVTIIEAITTEITPSFCNTTIESAFYDAITAEPIAGATGYRFRITDGVNTFTTGDMPTNSFVFNDFGANIVYGTTYDVSVSVEVDQAWSPFGPTCPITLTADPLTSLQFLCNGVMPQAGTRIYTLFVPLATTYRFSVTNLSTNEEVFVENNQRFFFMHTLSNFAFNTQYEVKVQVKIGDGNFGSWGPTCLLNSPASLPTTALRTEFCNITVSSLASNLFAQPVTGATAFRFRTTLGADVQVTETPGMLFRLDQISNPQFGQTYIVEVAAQVNGVWADYGAPCNVTTPAGVPSTQLRPQFCNITVPAMGSNLFATFVSNATAFRFRVSTNNTEVGVVETPGMVFNLTQLAVVLPGTTYSVEVAAQVNGIWGDYGTACNVTTPAVPTTRLRDAFCNVTISIPNANLFANSVSGADAFRYRVTNLTSNEVDEVVREGSGSLRFVLIWASSYSSDDNVYSVEVAARVGGVWGAYGTPCSVTVGVPNPIRVMNNSNDATVIGYPNPFSDGFSLRVNQNQPTDLVVTVYDMTGKVLEVVRWNTQNTNVLIGKNLPSGVYNIFVEGGEILETIKMVKK